MLKEFRLFLKFSRYLLPYFKKEILILVLAFLGVGAGLLNPYLTKLVIDKAFGNKDLRIFLILVVIGGGIFIINGILQGLKSYLERYISVKVHFGLSKAVFRHLAVLDLDYYRNKSSAGHHFRISNDISQTVSFITTVLPQVVSLFPRLLFTFIIVFCLSWKMAIFSLFLAPLLYMPPYYFSKKLRQIYMKALKNSEGIFKMLNEFFSHIHLVKAFGKETFAIRDYIRRLIADIRIKMQNTKLEIVSGFSASAATKLVIGLISFYGGYQVIRGSLSLGSLTAIMMYIGQLIGMQGNFAGLFQNIAVGLISCERINEVLEERPRIIEVESAKDISLERGDIAFQDVTFGYKEGRPILQNISFNIKAGSLVSFVGPSGCGKTTLLNLLLRLYEPWFGKISIDGYEIGSLKLSSLRSQIGIALQESLLFNDTIENNIRFGNPNVSFDEIAEIARICGVDEFVKQTPYGYKTIVGDNACSLSEGQKQKIAIARALIRKPKILILDEAMSSMDSRSEESIIEGIKDRWDIFTIIIVSHRLSTVMKVDRVYFLKSSDELLVGSAEEILDNKDFLDLFRAQAKEPIGIGDV